VVMGSLFQVLKGQSSVWSCFSKQLSVCIVRSLSSVVVTDSEKTEGKRPAGPFVLFVQSKSSGLRAANPDLRMTDIAKLAATMWKECGDTQQQFKKIYKDKIIEYKLNKESLPKVPRRPAPPFVQFYSDKNRILRYSYPSITQRTKKASQMWNNLSIMEKQRYKTAYKFKLITYTDNLSDEEKQEMKDKKLAGTAKRQQQDVRRYGKRAMADRPAASRMNQWSMFIREKACEEQGSLGRGTMMKSLGEKWKTLSLIEKNLYKEKALDANKAYDKVFEEWQMKNDRKNKGV